MAGGAAASGASTGSSPSLGAWQRSGDLIVMVVLGGMATRNGAAHLPAQLASLAAQSHSGWRLWVSDDGSTDATRALVQDFGRDHDVRLIDGPQRGAAANFRTLLARAAQDAPQAALAFSDQDILDHAAFQMLHGALAAIDHDLAWRQHRRFQAGQGDPGAKAADQHHHDDGKPDDQAGHLCRRVDHIGCLAPLQMRPYPFHALNS